MLHFPLGDKLYTFRLKTFLKNFAKYFVKTMVEKIDAQVRLE